MIHSIDTFPGREFILNGKPYLYFGGTAYLGMQTDTEFQQLFAENLRKYGTNYGASRKSNVRLSVYEATENFLAQWVGAPGALALSSGYLAGQLVSSHFAADTYKRYLAPNSHSALTLPISGNKREKPYVTYTSLNIALREQLAKNKKVTPVLCMDSIDFSGASYPHFEGLATLPLEDIIVVADDSHGIGITGTDGGGVYNVLSNFRPKELVVCCSLGKALGIQGGAVFADHQRLSKLGDTPLFGGASPPGAAGMATLMQARKLYDKKRQILHDRLATFTKVLGKASKLIHLPGHPSHGYSGKNLTCFLEKHGIIITDFDYPGVNSGTTCRIIITAGHTSEDIKFLARCLEKYGVDRK